MNSDNEIYVICGGSGSKAIEKIIDNQFGINLIERLIDHEKSNLRSTSQIGFFGAELLANRSFRSNYVLNDDDHFGKYYKGLDIFLDEEKLSSLGIFTKKRKLLVRGESGFKIDTRVSLEELNERIRHLSVILKEKPVRELNPFRKLSNKELEFQTSDGFLQNVLNDLLVKEYLHDSNDALEIFHPNLETFLSCSELIFKYKKNSEVIIDNCNKMTLNLIFNSLGLSIESYKLGDLKKCLTNIETFIIDPIEGEKVLKEPLLEWLLGEVIFKRKNYLRLGGDWYVYSDSYSKSLETTLAGILNRANTIKIKPWNTHFGSEGDYNKSYEDFALIGDKVFINNIEMADVIYLENGSLYFIHFKMGFDRNIRVVCNQIINSAKMVNRLVERRDSEQLESYYKRLVQNDKIDSPIKFKEFENLFMRRKIKFGLGYIVKGDDISLEAIKSDIKKTKSTIAKLSIVDCYQKLKQYDYELLFGRV